MDTPITTDKPLAAGNGRGQSKTGSASSKNRTESGAPESTPSEREPSTPSPLLGADGQAIPISEGGSTDSVIDRGVDLGRQAGDLGKRLSTMTQEYAKREPTRAVLISLGVGVVLGAVIGALLARE